MQDSQRTWDSLTCDLIMSNGSMYWLDENGNSHRDTGPAIIDPNGNQYWAKHGKYHREDGPAIIYSTGDVEYWIEDRRLTETQFNVWKQSNE